MEKQQQHHCLYPLPFSNKIISIHSSCFQHISTINIHTIHTAYSFQYKICNSKWTISFQYFDCDDFGYSACWMTWLCNVGDVLLFRIFFNFILKTYKCGFIIKQNTTEKYKRLNLKFTNINHLVSNA